jgi:Flp pilus assembly pilin Flp
VKTQLAREDGQTVIEYMMLILVMASLIIGLFGKLRTNFIGDTANCGAANQSIMCSFQDRFLNTDWRYHRL